MEFIDELYAKFGNQTEDLFTFDATNIDGMLKYLKTVTKPQLNKSKKLLIYYLIYILIPEQIDWTEKWIISLISFHVTTFLVILLTKSYLKFQTCMFALLRI